MMHPDLLIEPDPDENEPPEYEITESDMSPLDWDPRESLDDPVPMQDDQTERPWSSVVREVEETLDPEGRWGENLA